MYHKKYYKRGVVTSATCVGEHDEGEDDSGITETVSGITETVSGVCEMKNSQKSSKQLHSLHSTTDSANIKGGEHNR